MLSLPAGDRRFMKAILSIALSIALAVPAARAQEFLFRVLASKGYNEVKSAAGWQLLKIGSGLSGSDQLKLSDNAYVALAHQSGALVELKSAGTYAAADLAGKVKGGSGILRKYTDFILSKAAEDVSKMIATGSVHRGFGDEVDAYLPDMKNSFLYSGRITLAWAPTSGGGPYEVVIRSQFNEVLLQEKVSATQLAVNLDEHRFRDQDFVMVYITSASDPELKSEEHMIRRMYPAEQDKVALALAELTAGVGEDSALSHFIRAGFFEEKKLLIDACTRHQEAIRLAPDVPVFSEAYENFLIRNGMKSLPLK
jgi:hypothetical protein